MRGSLSTSAAAAVVVVVLSTVAGCGGGTEPGPPPLCEPSVAVTVTSGIQPEVRWTPACRVHTLVVERVADRTVHWFLLAAPDTDRAIVPPVRYSVVPAGTIDLTFGQVPALETGTTYAVKLVNTGFPCGDPAGRRRGVRSVTPPAGWLSLRQRLRAAEAVPGRMEAGGAFKEVCES